MSKKKKILLAVLIVALVGLLGEKQIRNFVKEVEIDYLFYKSSR